jgi:hypothetical protein
MEEWRIKETKPAEARYLEKKKNLTRRTLKGKKSAHNVPN